MKWFFHPVVITLVVVTTIASLNGLLSKKKLELLDDDSLRTLALSHNMHAIPTEYQKLLTLVDTPKNPLSPEKIALGKALFFDTLLSKDKYISCASCHILEEGGDDNLPTAIGYHGLANPSHLNSPTVLNAALARFQFWDGRAKDVEEQAAGPMQAPFEMHMTPDEVVKRVSHDTYYAQKFQDVFGTKEIRFTQIQQSIGAYERTLLTRGKYDAFLEGNNSAMSPQAKRGMTRFIKAGCMGCHTGILLGGQSIQKFPLRRYPAEYIGMLFKPNVKINESPYPFENTGGYLGRDDTFKFKVPTLRNITRTAPYFHNGTVDKIEEAVRIMSKYQLGDEFSQEEIADVVAFLKTLEGDLVLYDIKE
ncbi:MAG TPA: c-type cytochrome [Epsilonproteobacteria bacterium]|nr:c-type cytochrome [Campylobacterota bacterium]